MITAFIVRGVSVSLFPAVSANAQNYIRVDTGG
jgi:hypothetical protein